MSPIIGSHFVPEVESAGTAKRRLDVLLWLNGTTAYDLLLLDEVERLREYLSAIDPSVCSIRIRVPQSHEITMRSLRDSGIFFETVPIAASSEEIDSGLSGESPIDLRSATSTALHCDADLLVVNEHTWFPYLEDLLLKFNILLADLNVLKLQSEIFVRGFDIPWAFSFSVWHSTWTIFYPMAEELTFNDGLVFFNLLVTTKSYEAAETTRMLILNRLPNLCFTRDRLLFYDLQQNAAKRAKWTRQTFAFEAGYYLNFYYLLLFGGIDHIAMIVNQSLNLGLQNRQVAAMSRDFLRALKQKAPEIHELFTEAQFASFLERIATLRHFAAHRGSIMPSDLYVKPEVEKTCEELDEELAKSGRDEILKDIPFGSQREGMRTTLRQALRLELSEKIADGIVEIELGGRRCQIRPMTDTEWNFDKFHSFMIRVMKACKKWIETIP